MSLQLDALHMLCPLHAALDRYGRITQTGPSLEKVVGEALVGQRFLDVFEVYRPRSTSSMSDLLQAQGRKLHLRLRKRLAGQSSRTQFKGLLAPDGKGGGVINLSFGIAVVDAVRDHALTSKDFAPTDLAVEMLYLVEAKSAAMDASRRLNTRLQGAMLAAEERAFTDTLTGLKNRRALDHVLGRLAPSGQAFALMHLDLDFFKQVNDTMGHAAGDRVLQVVARAMVEMTRKDDTVARVGGDEFVILLANAIDRDRLAGLSRALIDRIEQPIPFDGKTCQVSASIGISQTNGDGCDIATLLEQADIALYASKRAGRAQYFFYEDAEQHDDANA